MSVADHSNKTRGSRQLSRVIWRILGCFYTTYLSVVVLGVTSASAAGFVWALVVGCSIDALRRLIAPEFVIPPDDLVRSFERAGVAGPDTAKHMRKLNIAALGVFLACWGYVPLLMLGQWMLGTAALLAWVDLFAPLTELATELVPLIQRHSIQLAVVGQDDKARVLAHIYALSLVTILIIMVIGARGLSLSISFLDQRASKEDGTLRFSHRRKKPAAILAPLLPLFAWFALNYALEADAGGLIRGKHVGLFPFLAAFPAILVFMMACQHLGAWLVAVTGPAGSRLEKM